MAPRCPESAASLRLAEASSMPARLTAVAIAAQIDDLQVHLLHPAARPPERSRPGDAAYDLRCVEAFALEPGERRMVPTGVAIALPSGTAGLVVPRSGLAIEHGISVVNGPGLVDPNYRGELRVILVNLGSERFEASAGDRIAQLLVVPFCAPELRLVDELPESERGSNGFGSSGR
jgi:dUTP diphosphatase